MLLKRIFYGWPMLFGLSVAETISWGVLYYAFSVFIRPMEAELGWSRAQVTGAFSLALLVSGLAAVPIGRWLDARGPRALMTSGSLLAAVLLLAWSRAQSLSAFYLIWTGLGIAMAAVLYEPAFAVVARWFVRRRETALTVLTVFGGLASTLFVPLASVLLARLGWRGAVTVLALLLAATTVPLHGLLLRRDPHDVGSEADGGPPPIPSHDGAGAATLTLRTALGSPAFRRLTAVFVLSSFATVGTSVHLLPYFLDRHVPAATAAMVVGLLGLMQVPGRALYGSLRKRWSAEASMAGVFGCQSLAVLSLPWIDDEAPLFVFAPVFGMANGLSTIFRAAAVADIFGPSHYGRIGGVLTLFTTAARAAGPLAVALAYQAFGSYAWAFSGLAASLALAAMMAVRRPWPGARPVP